MRGRSGGLGGRGSFVCLWELFTQAHTGIQCCESLPHTRGGNRCSHVWPKFLRMPHSPEKRVAFLAVCQRLVRSWSGPISRRGLSESLLQAVARRVLNGLLVAAVSALALDRNAPVEGLEQKTLLAIVMGEAEPAAAAAEPVPP